MNKPTCESCPFWDGNAADLDGDSGPCLRFPPSYPDQAAQKENTRIPVVSEHGRWPWTLADDWCGEHPDFPAYLASLVPTKSLVLPPGGD